MYSIVQCTGTPKQVNSIICNRPLVHFISWGLIKQLLFILPGASDLFGKDAENGP